MSIMAKPHYKSIPQLTDRQVAYIWSKVKFNETSGCDEWIGMKRPKGYGYMQIKRRKFVASRVVYFLLYGVDPGELNVLHRCDNPPCVTKEHLFLGTTQDNSDDMVAKGRSAKGERSGHYTHPERTARGVRHGRSTKPERTARGDRSPAKKHP